MKKIIPFLLFTLSIFASIKASAQGFATQYGDTVIGGFNGTTTINLHNNIRSTGSSSVVINWKMIDSYYAPGVGSNGFCDNNFCQDSAHANNGAVYTSTAYTSAFGDFHALFKDYGSANNSSSWVKILVTEGPAGSIGGSSRTLVFMVNKNATTSINNTKTDDNVTLYPNPARESVNVVFDKLSNVKTIAIYNMIGKTMRVFKPTDNNSARLDLDNIPSGVYFVRLLNNDGAVIATRRFTRQ